MVQFYFLSIFVNVIGGLLLAGDAISQKTSTIQSLQEFFRSTTNLLVFSIVAAVAALFKVISVFEGDIYVIGDLIPAAASAAIAVHFFSRYLYEKKGSVDSYLEKANVILEEYKTILGIACIIIAILHFFFPGVLFI